MSAKIFISHQAADSDLAANIARRLRIYHDLDTYLDVIDPGIRSGEDLASHIQAEMGKCTQLLAVVSESTRASWWVPWEIGVATEKDFPLATYADGPTLPPEYLRKGQTSAQKRILTATRRHPQLLIIASGRSGRLSMRAWRAPARPKSSLRRSDAILASNSYSMRPWYRPTS